MPPPVNILLVALGSAGDVHPVVGLGCALSGRGHRVTLITNPHFASLVSAAGIDFEPVGTEKTFLRVMKIPDLWHPFKGFRVVAQQFMLPIVRELYELLERRAGSEPTVIAAPGMAFGARLLHEKRGVPLATIHLQPAGFRSLIDSPQLPCTLMGPWVPRWFKQFQYWAADNVSIDRWLGPELNAVRSDLGLPPVRGILRQWWNSPQRIIGLFPDWFAPPQPDWPPQVRLTGFPLWDQSGLTEMPPGLEEFLAAGSSPIVFTCGSAMVHGHAFFKAAVEACRLLGRRGLLLTRYPEQLPGQLPIDVAHFGYVPFSAVLPRSAAVVHHGGVGTSAQGLAAGVPQLVMPMSHDQPDNAARLARLGVGLSVKPKQFRGAAVAGHLAKLIDQPAVMRRCKELAARLDPQQALDQTCRELESLVPAVGGR